MSFIGSFSSNNDSIKSSWASDWPTDRYRSLAFSSVALRETELIPARLLRYHSLRLANLCQEKQKSSFTLCFYIGITALLKDKKIWLLVKGRFLLWLF